MAHGGLAQFAAVLGAVGVVFVLLARQHRLLLFGGFALLAAAEAGLGAALVPAGDLHRLGSPLRVGALAAGLLLVVGLATIFGRRPAYVAPAVLLAAPFRIPVNLGAQRAFLLLPLYAVLGACVLALLYRQLRTPAPGALPAAAATAIAGFMALDALSLLWSTDLHQGSVELGFFIFPFSALIVVVSRAPFPAWMPRALATILVALTSVFAVIGLWQAATHRVFFARNLVVENAYTTFFRVSSVFKDPSLYGRYLVLGIIVLLVALWTHRISVWTAAGFTALLWAGLYFSYSQSSMVTLFVLTVAVVLVAGERQARRAVLVACVIFVLLAGAAFAASASHHSARHYTSGRWRLVRVTLTVIFHNPLVGVGVGSQPLASHQLAAKRLVAQRNASHTTPLTVAAELGVVGVLLYLALLLAAWRLFSASIVRDRALGLGLAAVFLVLVVHSLFYAGFFEDPLTWGSLAAAAAALAVPPRSTITPAPPPAPVRTGDAAHSATR